jgi:hypothetical protein
LKPMLLWSLLPQAVWFAVVLGCGSRISDLLVVVVAHAVVSLNLNGDKAGALLGGGIRHDRQGVQPRPQRIDQRESERV